MVKIKADNSPYFYYILIMTRINAGIHPLELCNKHLLAEHREIKRIPNIIKSGKADLVNIPEEFTLGKGHVKFFYNKLLYLKKRYIEIYNELKRRDFNVTYFGDSFNDLPVELYNDWLVSNEMRARPVVTQRINEKLKSMKMTDEERERHMIRV